MIEYFEVENYKCFERLRLDGLARVNLIVGENGVGKTALLEALYLRANIGSPLALLEVLRHRGEPLRPSALSAFSRLLNARPATFGLHFQPDEVSYMVEHNAIAFRLLKMILRSVELSFDLEASLLASAAELKIDLNSMIVWSGGISKEEVEKVWDQIIIFGRHALVIDLMRLLIPKLEQVGLLADSSGVRQAHLKLDNDHKPVVLGRFGEGSERLFGLAVAVIASAGNQLMIDEIEIGLHYTLHEKLWQFVFDMAVQLDVQIFATTHSSDMTSAFARVASRHPAIGKLFRLDRSYGRLKVVDYNEEEMLVAAEEGYEVR